MGTAPLLSVVIPVYRTEAYLRACLDSVARQSLQGIEVIIVNDGSPDQSQRIINAYTFVFENIRSIQTENQGQSAARNLGMEHANGKYLAFLDSDDKLPPDAYEALVREAQNTDADICVGIGLSFNESRSWVNPQMSELYECVANHATLEDLLPLVRDASPWNKVFLRSFLQESKLQFPLDIGLREDLHFVLRAYAAAKSITVIPAIVCHYRAREDAENLSKTEEVHAKVFDDLVWVSRDLDRQLRGSTSELVLREKTRSFLTYITFRLPKFIDAHPEDEQEATLEMLREYFEELPKELFDSITERSDRKLVELTTAGHYDELRRLVKTQTSDDETRPSKPLRKRLKRLERDTRAQAQKAISEFTPPSANAIARELKLAVATGRNLIQPTRPTDKEVWIVGERHGQSAEDTGLAFFRFLRTAHPEIDAYFITKSDSRGRERAAQLGNLLEYGSSGAYEMILQARVIAYSDSGQDIAHRWTRIAPLLRSDVVGCFLQHGVIGLHAMGDYYAKKTMLERSEKVDLFVTSSKSEKSYVASSMGFDEDEVVVTGLSRFDSLSCSDPQREILYMPTWREWDRDSNVESFQRSQSFLAMQSLLSDYRLIRLLEEHDYRLVFLSHFAMENLAHAFRSAHPRIEIVGATRQSIQHYVKRSRLLITDYSSVSYDFAYQLRPVLFYQFDSERFYRSRGVMTMDPTEEMMGDVVRTQDAVLAQVQQFLESNQEMSSLYRDRAQSFFPHIDSNNSERIYQAIVDCQKSKRAAET